MIQAYQAKIELSFKVDEATFEQVSQWTYSVDEAVFREQLATGSFRNHPFSPDTLELMRQIEKEGKIMPYYGVGGSSGVCTYHFRFAPPECHLKVEHSATRQNMEINTSVKVSRFAFAQTPGRCFKFSPFPYLLKRKLPKEWSGAPPRTLICRLTGREFQKLSSWGNWDAKRALTSRYEYSFSEVSMGASGFVAQIKDIKSGEILDVTDYANW